MSPDDKRFFKKELKFVWNSFFGMFRSLTSVQKQAIPIVLNKENCVISSATASGKTEAVLGPVLETMYREKWSPVSVLYICPTRALVNDMYKRFLEQTETLDVSIAIKTGDKNNFKFKSPQDVLITTPESMDSLISRHPKLLTNIRAVIVDEIHLIDNTYRGDQMLFLLRRLKKITNNKLSIYLISATISDPDSIGKRYIGENNFKVVHIQGNRDIEYTFIPHVSALADFVKKEHLRKLLVFCNRRRSVEGLSQELANIFGKRYVGVHHGSLSKQEREEIEHFMKEGRFGICVSTMTMEVGIDIGSLDAVVIAEPPWTLPSFIQRIGRAGRKKSKSRVFLLYNSLEEKYYLSNLISLLKSNNFGDYFEYLPDLSVIPQQLFSILYGNPSGVAKKEIFKIFHGFCDDYELREILHFLSEKGWITETRDKWFATENLMDLGEKGKIHSNIPNAEVMYVKEINSGKVIGEVILPIDSIFILSGKVWRIVKIVDNIIFVKHAKIKGNIPSFKPIRNRGAFYYFLPPDIRAKMDAVYKKKMDEIFGGRYHSSNI